MLNLSLELGDRLVLTDLQTGDVTLIEIDRARGDKARLVIDAPTHIHIAHDDLDQRIEREQAATKRENNRAAELHQAMQPGEGGAA